MESSATSGTRRPEPHPGGPLRIALLTNILAPYRIPAFRALGETEGFRLRVFVNAEREFDRPWLLDAGDLDVERLPGVRAVRAGRTLHLPSPPAFFRALWRFRPDAVISGELGARTLLAWLFCAATGVPLAIWAEPTRGLLARTDRLRRWLGPFLLARADAVVVPGREARRALLGWGVPATRLVTAPNCHDAESYAKALACLDTEATRHAVRAALGGRSRVALAVGRLLDWKGTRALLDAWERVPSGLRREWTLVFVGEGPEAARVAAARARSLPGELAHVPRATAQQLAELYASADLLVMPTLGEPWGIVVNEAMACGLPVLCSVHAGCAEDLVEPGRTGWLADPRDPDAFRDALVEALRCGQRVRLGARARERVAHFTPEAMAEGFRRAVRAMHPGR